MKNKIKEITIDGETYRLAPLKCNQIEELVEGPFENESYADMRARTWKTVHASLENAAKLDQTTTPSIDDLKATLDLEGYIELHKTALIASKIRKEEEPKAAETAAA